MNILGGGMMIPVDEIEKLHLETNKMATKFSDQENLKIIELSLHTLEAIAPTIAFLAEAKTELSRELALDLLSSILFSLTLTMADSTDEAILIANKLKEEIINADKKIVGD